MVRYEFRFDYRHGELDLEGLYKGLYEVCNGVRSESDDNLADDSFYVISKEPIPNQVLRILSDQGYTVNMVKTTEK